MIRMLLLTLIASALSIPAAQARPWNILDLGRFYKEEHCMVAAQMTFRSLLGEREIATTRQSNWVAYANGIEGVHDAIITCTFGDNRGTRATLVMHSRDKPVDAHFLTRRISTLFEANRQKVTQAWKDSYQ